MRWVVVGSGLVYGALGLGGWALGCDARAQERRVMPLREATGTVKTVDPQARTVELQLKERRATFRVDSDTVIFSPGRQGTLADLSEGQEVRVAYEPGGEAPSLQWVELAGTHRR